MFSLNLYTSNTIQDVIFKGRQNSMEDKAQLMTTALLQLEELNAVKAEEAINDMEELNTTRTVVTDGHGLALYDSLRFGNAEGKYLLFPELLTALEGQDVFYSRYRDRAIECRLAVPLVRDGKILGAIYLMEYNTEQGRLIHALERNIMRISLVLEGGIILFALIFSKIFSGRMRRILTSVRNMRNGDYSQRISLRGTDEMVILAQEFNELSDRLEDSEQRRRRFVSDASHELKTPLATIKLLSDSILQNEMDPVTEREFIGDIGREADRLGRLTRKLLALTKIDSAMGEEMEILDPATTVHKVARMIRPLAKPRGIRVECNCEKNCLLMMVEDDLYQIVFNLAENAIKYNHDGGWIGLELIKTEEMVELVVSDSGVGIPEESMPHIFDRFYRVDKARSRAAGGAGLGLSIVHAMVKRNFGTIEVTARPEGGTVFTVRFPLFDVQEEV
ncbi:MAG: HAMP domain-containing histidine kinase [Oscillospiraceae bacterium]|nr:HAMP domain-containing histidine kinase [Oscillospiraceae bacterium]